MHVHMRALRHIRPLLTTDAAKTIASAIIDARLDYCNSILYGSSARYLDRLQKVQNQLARVVLQLPWSASATDARRQLHWLPVTQRIVFKLECGPMPNVMAALPNIGGALCSTPQSLSDAHYSSAVQ